jgi:hypothetical protein
MSPSVPALVITTRLSFEKISMRCSPDLSASVIFSAPSLSSKMNRWPERSG